MGREEVKTLVLRVAEELAGRGPGWSQEGVVLREVGDRLAAGREQVDVMLAQTVLDAWHDLFIEKKLGWGYDLDNPSSPFFHVRASRAG